MRAPCGDMGDRREIEEYRDEAYFDSTERTCALDSKVLREPVTILPARKPLVLSRHDSVTEAVRCMKNEGRGVVLVTDDGSPSGPIIGIFTERDVLQRVVDGGRNPAVLPLSDVMTPDPECLSEDQTIAEALNLMSVGGFRHVPVVCAGTRSSFVVSVRDVVQFLVEAFPNEILNIAVSDRTREREGG